MKIYCGGAGTLTYEWYMYFSYYDAGVLKGGPLPTRDSTLAITSDMLDSQGYLHLMFYVTKTKQINEKT